MLIRDIKSDDLDVVVRIHQEAFPNYLMTMLGPKFLYEYYNSVLGYAERIFLAAVDGEGVLCGFVAGFSDPSLFYSQFNKIKKKLIFSSLFHVFCRPALWSRVYENMRKVESLSSAPVVDDVKRAELSSVAVSPKKMGGGVGKILVASFIHRAKANSVINVDLTTDSVGNDYVNGFYSRLGFVIVEKIRRVDGRCMNKFEYRIE